MGHPSHRNVVTRSYLGFPRTAGGNHRPWWITRTPSRYNLVRTAALASAVGAPSTRGLLDVGAPHHRLYWRNAELATLSLKGDFHFRDTGAAP
jgi:hypothetical protein